MDRVERKRRVLDAMLCMQRWPWEQGVASQALLETGEENLAILFAQDAVTNQWKDGRLAMKSDRYAALDPAANGEAVLFAYKKTGDERFKKAFDKMADYILFRAPRTTDGVLFHNENEGMIWSDAVFMIAPFLVLAGKPEEAIKQIKGHWKYLLDSEKKILSHQYDADRKILTRKAFWGVGNGWNAAGITRVIRMLPLSMASEKKNSAQWQKV